MKLLILSALLCATMVFTGAAKHRLVKRSTFCPCGWTEHYDNCLIYVAKALPWAEAQKNCETMNANLASAHSHDEYHLIQKVVSAASNGFPTTWIGGSDAQQEKHWFWIDGTTFKYSNWCPGQPDNHAKRQHCMVMNWSGNKCWDDQGCEVRHPSVCVKRILQPAI